jgi:hypothetical protein
MNATLITILSTFMTVQVAIALCTVLGLVMVDFILGVMESFRSGNFSFSKLPQFMETSLVPYMGGLLVLALFSTTNTELTVLFYSISATVTAKFLADITLKVTQLFNGISIQSPITVSSTVSSTQAAPAAEAPVAPPAG